MNTTAFPTVILASLLALNTTFGDITNSLNMPTEQVLSSHQISLEDRQPVPSVNEVFKDNILLNLAYMRGLVHQSSDIKWEDIRQPFNYDLQLAPGETFAFHDTYLPEYQGKVSKTGNAHFNGAEGFKSDGYLVGDGVCHLASIIYWTALDAQLDTKAPTNHDFAKIEEISREYGVSIFAHDGRQNLYITNNKQKPIAIRFEYDGVNLKVSVAEPI